MKALRLRAFGVAAGGLVRGFAIALTLAGATGAQAQQASSPPATPRAASAPLTPAAPSSAQLAAARDLVVACGISRSFAIVIPQFMDQIGANVTQTRPELIRDLNAVLETLKPEFDQQADEMINLAAQIYAKLLSEQELRAAATFFSSPVGQRYVETEPAFLNELLPAMQNWQQRISAYMMERVRAEMKKKGHDL